MSDRLLDTDEDYSIVSQELADRLRKVKTPWEGPPFRSAGGHLMTPVGKCTARIRLGGTDFVLTFVVLPLGCKALILGMDFLREPDAVIDIGERLVSLSTAPPPEQLTDQRRLPLRIADDDVNVRPQSCAFVAVVFDDPCTVGGDAELHTSLYFDHDFSVARGLEHLSGGRGHVLLTNFANKRRHLTKGTTVAFFEGLDNAEGFF